MTIEFGLPVPLDEISLADVLSHPIWVWVWEAGREGEADDETWQCPVIGTTNVTPGLVEPVITLRIEAEELHASASYSREQDRLEAISVWQDGAWVPLQETSLRTPVVFVAIPDIDGVPGVRFACKELASDLAARAA